VTVKAPGYQPKSVSIVPVDGALIKVPLAPIAGAPKPKLHKELEDPFGK
jgi:hypothetical protein